MDVQIKTECTHEGSSVGVTNVDLDKLKQEPPIVGNFEKSKVAVKSEMSQLDIKQEEDDIDIKLESLTNEEVDIKTEFVDTPTLEQNLCPCVVCDKTYSSKDTLKRHLLIHKEIDFECNLCDKQFSNKYSLMSHKKVHNGEKPYKCKACIAKSPSKYDSTSHSSVHTGEKRFECLICSKKFPAKYVLTKHMKGHAGRSFECETCNAKLTYECSLEDPVKIRTEENPVPIETPQWKKIQTAGVVCKTYGNPRRQK